MVDVNSNKEFSAKEVAMINKVMSKYDVKTLDMEKIKNNYKIVTDKGTMLLKKMRHGKYKAANGCYLVEHLNNENFHLAAKYIRTSDGNLYVKFNNILFCAAEWIDGEECNLNNLQDSIGCAKLLAEFHNATKNIDIEKLKIKNNLENWPKIFNDNLRELERYKKLIERKKIKNEFDSIYLSYIDEFIHQGLIALKFINDSEYYRLSKDAAERKTICYDKFYFQNIVKNNNKFYLTDLDSLVVDLHINDLGKLIRKLMHKTDYKWNFSKAKKILEAYMSIVPLSKNELEVMLALIIFPHKFWKLGHKRYIKYKNWPEERYIEKLNKLITYSELQKQFLVEYIEYINSISENYNSVAMSSVL